MPLVNSNILLIANPASQNGKGADAAFHAYKKLCAKLEITSVDLVLTEHPGHATSIASDATSDTYNAVIALGGDGIVHEVVQGLMCNSAETRPTLGVIPVGSGNDFAKTLGMTENITGAIADILKANICSYDVGCCNGQYFVETLSFGLDAAIALDTVERRKVTGKQGMALYFESGLNQLINHLDTYSVKAILNKGQSEISGHIILMAVQIGPTYGGGFSICPAANPMDGTFDICYVEGPMNRFVATFKFLSAKSGKHVDKKGVHFAKASTLKITFDRIPPSQIDGEPLVADKFDVSILPRQLKVFVAEGSKFSC